VISDELSVIGDQFIELKVVDYSCLWLKEIEDFKTS
jgi:hypothetical protein